MKLLDTRLLDGPNLWAPESGLLATLLPEPGDVPGPDWCPQPDHYAQALGILARGIPTGVRLPGDDPFAALAVAERPLIVHLLGVTAGLLGDFCSGTPLGRVLDGPGPGLELFVPCDDPVLAVDALKLSIASLPLLRVTDAGQAEARVTRLFRDYQAYRRRAAPLGLSQAAVWLTRAARARDIPRYRCGAGGNLFQFGQGCLRQRTSITRSDLTGSLAAELIRDKLRTVRLLSSFGLPTPATQAVASADAAVACARALGRPVVVKPRGSLQGKGVSVGLTDDDAIRAAFAHARAHGAVIVEPMVAGDDHRLLVVGGRLVAASRRVPGHVVGDGARNVRALVDGLNRQRGRWLPFEGMFDPIEFDAEAEQTLAWQGLNPGFVPARGQRVWLRRTANISRGGEAEDVTDVVHPHMRELAERASRIVGAPVLGVDVMTTDISRSWREVEASIIEVNDTPGLNPHLGTRTPRDVSPALMEVLFAPGRLARIPIIAVVGGGGEDEGDGTRVSALVDRLSARGLCVAWSTGPRQGVGEDLAPRSDASGAAVNCGLLLDPSVQAAVFAVSLKAVIERGMGLDACEVVLMKGPSLDTAEGLPGAQGLRALDVVARTARRRVLLDVDDAQDGVWAAALIEGLPTDRLCLISARASHPWLIRHRQRGGRAVCWAEAARREVVVYHAMQEELRFCSADDAPGPAPDLLWWIAVALELGLIQPAQTTRAVPRWHRAARRLLGIRP